MGSFIGVYASFGLNTGGSTRLEFPGGLLRASKGLLVSMESIVSNRLEVKLGSPQAQHIHTIDVLARALNTWLVICRQRWWYQTSHSSHWMLAWLWTFKDLFI